MVELVLAIAAALDKGDKTKATWCVGVGWDVAASLNDWEARNESSCPHWFWVMGHWGALNCDCDKFNWDCAPRGYGEQCIISDWLVNPSMGGEAKFPKLPLLEKKLPRFPLLDTWWVEAFPLCLYPGG